MGSRLEVVDLNNSGCGEGAAKCEIFRRSAFEEHGLINVCNTESTYSAENSLTYRTPTHPLEYSLNAASSRKASLTSPQVSFLCAPSAREITSFPAQLPP